MVGSGGASQLEAGSRLPAVGAPNTLHTRWQDTALSHLRIYTVAAESHVYLGVFNPVCVFRCYDVATNVFIGRRFYCDIRWDYKYVSER